MDLLSDRYSYKVNKMDPLFITVWVLLAVTITAFLIGLIPYPFGWIVLTGFLLLRLIHLWQKDRQK